MSWKKVKLGDILTESKIISENPNPDRRITVRLKVLGVEKRGLENEVEGATKQYVRKAGQFIYGKQNFHKGAFGIIPPELDGFESSSDLPAFDVDNSCLPEFVFYFFKQGDFYLELSKIASGVATQRINTTQLFELELLLPEIKTQRRLIENIQLLEKNGSEISTELTHQLNLVKKLRQQLLQDTVLGKLVPQNPSDELASELLKKIKAEKAKLIAEKKLKKEKDLPPIYPEEIPFTIPDNWVWCRLATITNFIDYRGKTPNKVDKGIKLITAKNVKFGYFSNEPEEYISERDYALHMTRGIPNNGDILFTTEAPLGNACLLNYEAKFALAQRIITIQPILFNNQFLLYSILSEVIQKQLIKKQSGATAKGIKSSRLVEVLIPLPPLSEQTRIVQKVDELMRYCNELEASIKQSQQQNEKLLQQVLREALRKEPVAA
jgi:type I restriction enzyme S subunit